MGSVCSIEARQHPHLLTVAQIKYITVLLELEVIEDLRTGGSKFALVLPGAQGRALHAKGTDSTRVAKLQRLRAQYEERLDVDPVDGWPQGSPEFIAAMTLVRESEIRRLQVWLTYSFERARPWLSLVLMTRHTPSTLGGS